MRISVVTPPATEPITLAEAKLHFRQDISADDATITAKATAARIWCENWTRRCFVTTQLKLSMDSFNTTFNTLTTFQAFGTALNPYDQTIRLPRASVISVDAITYVDTNGQTQTLASDQYLTSLGNAGRIVPAFGKSWPNIRIQPDSVNITFTVGYGNAAACPETVKQAISMLAYHLYENRSAVESGSMSVVPYTVEDLLTPELWGGF